MKIPGQQLCTLFLWLFCCFGIEEKFKVSYSVLGEGESGKEGRAGNLDLTKFCQRKVSVQ